MMIASRGRAAAAAALVWLAMAPAIHAAPDSVDPLAARLQAKLDKLVSLRGGFIQTLDSASLGRPRTEEGRFMIRKPNLMRWEYDRPEKKVAVVDGRHTWLYLPEDREVHRGAAVDLDRSGAASLLSGKLRLDADFDSRRLGPKHLADELPIPPRSIVLELIPRRKDLEFEKVLLAVEPDRLQILKLTLVDPLGDRMSFTFSGLEENPDLPDSLFRFEVPEGVRVVEASPE